MDDGWIITDSSALGFLFSSPTYHSPKTFIIRNESMGHCAMINHFSDDVSTVARGYFSYSSSIFQISAHRTPARCECPYIEVDVFNNKVRF